VPETLGPYYSRGSPPLEHKPECCAYMYTIIAPILNVMSKGVFIIWCPSRRPEAICLTVHGKSPPLIHVVNLRKFFMYTHNGALWTPKGVIKQIFWASTLLAFRPVVFSEWSRLQEVKCINCFRNVVCHTNNILYPFKLVPWYHYKSPLNPRRGI